MYATKSSVQKVEARGVTDGKCNVCGEQIMVRCAGRSIWVDNFCGGFGEVREVGEVYCPKCDGAPIVLERGTPIYESQLTQISTQ